MNSYNSIYAGIALSDLDCQPIGLDRADCADANNRPNSGEPRPCDYPVNVITQTHVREMTVSINYVKTSRSPSPVLEEIWMTLLRPVVAVFSIRGNKATGG